MSRLFDRVAKLEGGIGGAEQPQIIRIQFYDPETGTGGDAEMRRIESGEATWQRELNETEAEFEARALSEVRGPHLAVGYAE